MIKSARRAFLVSFVSFYKQIFLATFCLILLHLYIHSFKSLMWRHGAVVITAAQLPSTKSELRFCAGSNPACEVSEICDRKWSRLEIWHKRLSSVNHSAKTVHHPGVFSNFAGT